MEVHVACSNDLPTLPLGNERYNPLPAAHLHCRVNTRRVVSPSIKFVRYIGLNFNILELFLLSYTQRLS